MAVPALEPIDFRILGPLQVCVDGRDVWVGQGHESSLLVRLLLQRNQPVAAEVLIDALWGDDAPPSAPKMLQVYVARLRKRLGNEGERLETVAGGYRIRVEENEVDARRFERLFDMAAGSLNAGDPAAAAAQLTEALAVWRGDALADVRYEDFAQNEIRRLEGLRLTAREQRLEVELALGHHAAVVSEADGLVREHPYREELRRHQAIGLYRSGRQTEALDAVRAARTALAELGLEPGAELRELERAILRHDPSLNAASRGPSSEVSAGIGRRRWTAVAVVATVLIAALFAAALMPSPGDEGSTLRSVPAGSVGVIGADGRIVAAIPTTGQPGPVAAVAETVWVGSSDARTLTRIDARGRRVVQVVGLPAGPFALVASRQAAWTANEFNGTISQVLAGGNAVTGPIRVTPTSEGRLALALFRGALWVASQDDVVTRMDQRTLQGVATVRGLTNPDVLAAGEARVWALQAGRSTVTEIDPGTNAIAATIRVPGIPTAIAAGESALWVLTPHEDRLWRVDPPTRTLVTAIPVGPDPSFIAVGEGSVWVATASGTLQRVDPKTNRVTKTLPVARAIAGVAVGAGHVWLTVPA